MVSLSQVDCFTGVEPLNVTLLFATGVKLFDVQVFCFLLGVVATGQGYFSWIQRV